MKIVSDVKKNSSNYNFEFLRILIGYSTRPNAKSLQFKKVKNTMDLFLRIFQNLAKRFKTYFNEGPDKIKKPIHAQSIGSTTRDRVPENLVRLVLV